MKSHKFAKIFPMMSDEEFTQLKTSLKQNGYDENHPIWVYENRILDGRNKAKACKELGIKAIYKQYLGDKPLQFVLQENLHRRHLTAGQRAILALETKQLFEEEAKKRMLSGKKQNPSANLHEGRSDVQSGKEFGVSGRSVSEVKKIRKESPEDFKDIKLGRKTINEVSEKIKKAHVSYNGGENEWYTPPKFIESARKTMGSIDIDPASSEIANKIVNATTYYTIKTNGLDKDWVGNVWMNPPYAQPLINEFSQALETNLNKKTKQAVVLVNNATETEWFQRMMKMCTAICFPKSRIKFIDINGNAGNAPLQGQAILYFGKNKKLFKENFINYGHVLWNEEQ